MFYHFTLKALFVVKINAFGYAENGVIIIRMAFGGRWWWWGVALPHGLKLVRIMLQTWNLVRKYTHMENK